MKVNIIYWSGTGNTQMMSEAVAEGAEGAGAQVSVIPVAAADSSSVDADVVALGCPAMGAESLEDGEFEPWYASIKPRLAGKRVALFGSYDWGDGEWMRNWEQTCTDDGAVLVCDSVICNEAPDDDAVEACKALGKALA